MAKITNEKKKRLILIAICVVIFIIVILFIFKLALSNTDKNKSNIDNVAKMKGVFLDSEVVEMDRHTFGLACTPDEKVCIDNMDIVYDGNKGLIQYTVVNNCKKYCVVTGSMRECSTDSDCAAKGGTCKYKSGCSADLPECKKYCISETRQCTSNSQCISGEETCAYNQGCGVEIPAGKLRVVLGNYKLVFPYKKIRIGDQYISYFGYDNFNFSFNDITDYYVYPSGEGDDATMYDSLDDDAKRSIVVN